MDQPFDLNSPPSVSIVADFSKDEVEIKRSLAPRSDGKFTLGEAPGQFSSQGTHYKVLRPTEELSVVPRPLIVLIHGIGSTMHHFQLLGPTLCAAGWPVLVYDLLGRGSHFSVLVNLQPRRVILPA